MRTEATSARSTRALHMGARLRAPVGPWTSEVAVSIESLVRESEKLVELLDPIVEDIADIRLQRVR